MERRTRPWSENRLLHEGTNDPGRAVTLFLMLNTMVRELSQFPKLVRLKVCGTRKEEI